jgi:hypothetical protein
LGSNASCKRAKPTCSSKVRSIQTSRTEICYSVTGLGSAASSPVFRAR